MIDKRNFEGKTLSAIVVKSNILYTHLNYDIKIALCLHVFMSLDY